MFFCLISSIFTLLQFHVYFCNLKGAAMLEIWSKSPCLSLAGALEKIMVLIVRSSTLRTTHCWVKLVLSCSWLTVRSRNAAKSAKNERRPQFIQQGHKESPHCHRWQISLHDAVKKSSRRDFNLFMLTYVITQWIVAISWMRAFYWPSQLVWESIKFPTAITAAVKLPRDSIANVWVLALILFFPPPSP